MSGEPKHQHRIFLQTLLARRSILESTAIELYKRIITALTEYEREFAPTYPANLAGVRAFVTEVSGHVHDLGFQIKKTRDESSKGRWWYSLVNIEGDGEIAMSATDLQPIELSYFRELISGILESYPACSLGANEARSTAGKLDRVLNRAHAEDILNALVSRGWLHRSKRGRYSLGTRALAELETWLMQEYSDVIFKCGICFKIVTNGWACGNDELACEMHFHQACFAALSANTRAKCSGCQGVISGMEMKAVGERTVVRARDGDIGMFQKKRASRARGAAADDEEMEEDELESETEANGSQTIRKRAADPGTQSQSQQSQTQGPESEDDLYDEPPTAKRRR